MKEAAIAVNKIHTIKTINFLHFQVAYIQSSSEEDEETEKKLFQVPLLNTPSSSPTVPTVSNEERRSPIPSICPQDTDDVGTYDNLHIYWTRRNELQVLLIHSFHCNGTMKSFRYTSASIDL